MNEGGDDIKTHQRMVIFTVTPSLLFYINDMKTRAKNSFVNRDFLNQRKKTNLRVMTTRI